MDYKQYKNYLRLCSVRDDLTYLDIFMLLFLEFRLTTKIQFDHYNAQSSTCKILNSSRNFLLKILHFPNYSSVMFTSNAEHINSNYRVTRVFFTRPISLSYLKYLNSCTCSMSTMTTVPVTSTYFLHLITSDFYNVPTYKTCIIIVFLHTITIAMMCMVYIYLCAVYSLACR